MTMNLLYKTAFLFSILLVINVFTLREVITVKADVPTVLSINQWKSSADTILNITTTHASPSDSHFVDQIEVNVNGSVRVVTLSGQSTTTFLTQYNLGVITGTPSIGARAHCNVHGWSNWYGSTTSGSSGTNPDLSGIAIVGIAVIALIVIVLFARKNWLKR